MSTIDLVILGLIFKKPQSPYDLQKKIEEMNLSRWIKIGSYTVYKKVIQFESKNLVSSESVKHGNMPEKTIYMLTSQGKEHFNKLMERFSLEQTRVFLDFNAVIVNLGLLDDNAAEECIKNIRSSIISTKAQIEAQMPYHEGISLFGRTILEQQYMLLETLEKWEQNFEEELLKKVGRQK